MQKNHGSDHRGFLQFRVNRIHLAQIILVKYILCSLTRTRLQSLALDTLLTNRQALLLLTTQLMLLFISEIQDLQPGRMQLKPNAHYRLDT